MDLQLIYATPNYHKLVETVARVCYQSYEKDSTTSHNFIKAIMAKGHISVASVGNMVFKINEFQSEDELSILLADLAAFHEITPFIKWSMPDKKRNVTNKIYISMNMLTFLDIYNQKDMYSLGGVFDLMVAETDKVPHLKWFYDKSVELPEVANDYTALGIPKLYEPIVLDEDYMKLKALGLNDYELGIHATITMNFITDRSASLQLWRHWSGGCELSQRYVERGSAEFRELIIDDKAIDKLIDKTGKTEKEIRRAIIEVKSWLESINEDIVMHYGDILEECEATGIHKGRAKEIARSILPNAITTQCIQSRPYRNWLHLFELRDSNHAQREVQEDVIHMKRVLSELGVPVVKCE